MPSAHRNARITARFRDRERRLIEAAARLKGVHLSELVRNASLREARRVLIRDEPGNGGSDAE